MPKATSSFLSVILLVGIKEAILSAQKAALKFLSDFLYNSFRMIIIRETFKE